MMGVVKLLSPFGRLLDQQMRLTPDGPVRFGKVTALPYVAACAVYCDGDAPARVVWEDQPLVLQVGDYFTLNYRHSETTTT